MNHLKLVPPIEAPEPQKNRVKRQVTAITLGTALAIGLGAIYVADETPKGPIQLSKTANCSLKTEAIALRNVIQSNEAFVVNVMKPKEDLTYYEVFTSKTKEREAPASLVNPVTLYCGSRIVGLAGIYDAPLNKRYGGEKFPNSYRLRGNKKLDIRPYGRDLGVIPYNESVVQKTIYAGFDPEAVDVRAPSIQVSAIKSVDYSLGNTEILHESAAEDYIDSIGGAS